jgi:hypothetical protein
MKRALIGIVSMGIFAVGVKISDNLLSLADEVIE